MTTVHLFEDRGLGKAPFQVVGVYSLPSLALAGSNPAAYNNQLAAMPTDVAVGSCAFCGAALVRNFIVVSADSKRFSVGCDCVAKSGDAGLVDQVKLAMRKQRQQDRHAAQVAKYKADLADQRVRNGGLTDEEVAVQKREAIRVQRLELQLAIVDKLAPFIRALRMTDGDFCASMLKALEHCMLDLPPRCIDIIVEVAAKKAGRKGSKAFAAKYDELWDVMYSALADYAALPKF
jgi:hypothetical protein